MSLKLIPLSESNFSDYERLTSCESGGGCYCSFWHQKFKSMSEWETTKRENPETNRAIVREKIRSGFHVGVVAYENETPVAWISVGPLPEFYWTWRRVAQMGEVAKDIAGILCITVAPDQRQSGLQTKLVAELKKYAKSVGWQAIEGYPFDASAVAKHGAEVLWPGTTKVFIDSGFTRVTAHWLSNPEAERSIFSLKI